MYIVEFFGLPGSGKTTVSKLLKKQLKREGLPVLDQSEALYYCYGLSYNARFFSVVLKLLHAMKVNYKILRLFFNRYILSHDLLKSIKAEARKNFINNNSALLNLVLKQISETYSSEELRELQREWFYELIALYTLFERFLPSQTIVVTDEWFVHRALCNMASEFHSGAEEEIKKYLKLIPKSNATVYVDAQTSQSLSHIKARKEGHIFINKFSEQDSLKYLENNYKTALVILNNRENIIRVNNREDIDRLSSKIRTVTKEIRKSFQN